MITEYLEGIKELLDRLQKTEMNQLESAAGMVASSLADGGIVHVFGSGHSHILAEEVFFRSGGMVPVRPILKEELMLHKGAISSSMLERQNDYAKEFMKTEDIRSEDVVFVISTSGRNPVPVDVAILAKDKGAYVIGITSLEYSNSQPSRHKSGRHLHEVVDLVLDNKAPEGDAILSHKDIPVRFGPSSTIMGAAILNSILAQAGCLLKEQGLEPPIFISGNVEGADEHNQKLIEKYQGRIEYLS